MRPVLFALLCSVALAADPDFACDDTDQYVECGVLGNATLDGHSGTYQALVGELTDVDESDTVDLPCTGPPSRHSARGGRLLIGCRYPGTKATPDRKRPHPYGMGAVYRFSRFRARLRFFFARLRWPAS